MRFKAIFTALLVLILMLSSCGARTDADYEAILAELMPKAAEINEILWGDGLPTEEGGGEGIYFAVTEASPYRTLAELKAAVRKVYSEEYFAVIEEALFTNTEYTMARFSENSDGILTINSNFEPLALETVVDLTKAKLKQANGYMLTIEIPYTVRSREGRMEVVLVNEAGEGNSNFPNDAVWRFDSPTY